MKVTFLAWEYPPHVYGGAGVHVSNLTQALSKIPNMDIEVRTLRVGEEPHSEEVSVKRYDSWPLLREKSEPSSRSLFEAFSVDLAMVKDRTDSEIVHVHTWYTSLAGFFAKQLYDVKLVATAHSVEPKRPWKREAMGNAYRLSTWAERTCLEACDRVIAVSNEDKRDIIECYGIDESRIDVIPNGIDITKYRRREDSPVLDRYSVEKPYVLFLGRLSRQKGVFDVVEASSKLPEGVKMVLVTGRADEKGVEEEFGRMVKDRENIVWINRMLTEEEAVALYSGAEVFTAPSLYEPFGLINLEAMACGRPVVSTRVGGIKDVVIEEETGLLVPPNSPDELAKALNELLSNKALAEEMGRKGRIRVEREFSWERVAEKTLALYKSLI